MILAVRKCTKNILYKPHDKGIISIYKENCTNLRRGVPL